MRAFILVVIFLLISYYTHYTHSAEAENDSSLLHPDTDIQNPADTTSFDLLSMDIEDLMEIEVATVYAASKYKQKVTEAPSSVSIVTADDIKKYGYRTLADILRSIRGFYVTDDRNYSYAGSRDFCVRVITTRDSRLYYREFDDPASNYGIAKNSDSNQYESIFGELSFRDFTLQWAFVSREKEIPTASYGTVSGNAHNYTLDEQGYLYLLYENNFDDLLTEVYLRRGIPRSQCLRTIL